MQPAAPQYFLVTLPELKLSLTGPVGNASHQGCPDHLKEKLGNMSHELRSDRHYVTNREVAGSIPDEVNFLIYLILPAALGPGVYSAPNRNEYHKQKIIMFLGSKVRPVRRADNLTATCEPTV
jgi:hypothetical protein